MNELHNNDLIAMPTLDPARVTETLRTRYWSWVLRSPTDGPKHLLELLLEKLPHIPINSWSERFDFGGIYINGHEALTDQPLPIPAKVEYYEPKFLISDASKIFPTLLDDHLLFSDSSVAVVYKPPHLPSMPAKEQRHFSLKASLEKRFGCTIHMPSRLDVSAQGIVIVSTSPLAHANLQRAFETRVVKKEYRFATDRECDWTTKKVTFNIALSPDHPVLRVASRTDGQDAETDLEFSRRISSGTAPLNIFTARPRTGRTHQIRVHAAASGLSIFGDNFYGGAPAPYLHLVSCAISLPHPVTQRELTVQLPEFLAPAWVRKPSEA